MISGGHFIGAYSAIHFTTVRCSTLDSSLAERVPKATCAESIRWRTICGADIRPHRATLVGWSESSRPRISTTVSAWASVFIRLQGGSRSEQPIAAGLAERGQRAFAPRVRRGDERLELRILAECVEL